MQNRIINKESPLIYKGSELNTLKEFYQLAIQQKAEAAIKIIDGFMWLKINVAQIKAVFNEHKAHPDVISNIAVLGSDKGMPLHLERYSSQEACEDGIKRIVSAVEESIVWAKENNRLSELLGTLTTGCCMESHSSTLLDYVKKFVV